MKSSQEKINRLNLVLRVMRSVNQLIVRERNRNKLLSGICRNLIKNRSFYNVWIALFDEAGGLTASAQAGLGEEFSGMIELLKRGDLPDCAQRALSQQRAFVIEDPEIFCADCPLSKYYGGRRGLTIRVGYKERAYGVLCVSTPKNLIVDSEEKILLEEFSGDLAFALHAIELEEYRNKANKSLQEAEKRYRSVFENTGAATLIIEEDTTISMINTRFEQISGYSKKDVEGRMKLTEFVLDEDKKRLKDYHIRRRRRGEDVPTEYEFCFVDKNGKRKDMFCKIGLIPGTNKSIASWIDITSLKIAEDALMESERRLSTLISNLPGMTYRCLNDENWTMEFVSAGCKELTGYKPSDFIGNRMLTYNQAIYAEDRKLVWNKIQEDLREKRPFRLEYRIQTKSGKIKWVWEQGVGIFSDKGELLWLEGFITDISERKQAEKALQESEKRLRDLVDHSLIGISIIQEGRVIYRNPEQKRLFGSMPLTSNLLEYDNIHHEDREKFGKLYKKISSGKAQTLETDFRFYPFPGKNNKDDMKWVYCRASVIEYKSKDAILMNIMDMTKAKELERLLMIQDKMASLGRVATGIAHEIRNPLTAVNMYLDALKTAFDRQTDERKQKETVDKLQSASNKIESVIRRVMDFSKPSEPRFVLEEINLPIEDAMKLSSVTLRKSGIKIEKKLAENLPLCKIDPHFIEEVILNLINNASEAMKNMDKDKKIKVSTSREGNFVIVRIADSGPGVLVDLRNKIFEPFYTTKKDSTGIGLSLVHRVITDHGGTIVVKTSKWGGAEFRIKIPIANRSKKK